MGESSVTTQLLLCGGSLALTSDPVRGNTTTHFKGAEPACTGSRTLVSTAVHYSHARTCMHRCPHAAVVIYSERGEVYKTFALVLINLEEWRVGRAPELKEREGMG